jgi:hypothetical protein
MDGFSIAVKHFFRIGPPFPLLSGIQRVLTGFTDIPPLLGHGIGGHLGHIAFIIVSDIFKITEQQAIVVINRIVPDVAFRDHPEHIGPNRHMEFFIFFQLIGPDAYYRSVTFHVCLASCN